MFHIVHIDPDQEMRAVVAASLGLETDFSVIGASSLDNALAGTSFSGADLIICNIRKAGSGEIAVLLRLREGEETRHIPTIVTTSSPDANEHSALKALGAVSIITTPFEAADLVEHVRNCLTRPEKSPGDVHLNFARRLGEDGSRLSALQQRFLREPRSVTLLEDLQASAHKLAGAAAVYGATETSAAAARLEDAVIAFRARGGSSADVERSLDQLIARVNAPGTRSETGRGSTKDAAPALRDAPTSRPIGQRPRLLVADDDPAILELLTDILTRMGFQVETATNGVQASVKARRYEPDVAIFDIHMPGADGLSASARLLGPTRKPIDVILMTGRPDAETAERCDSLGAYLVLKDADFLVEMSEALMELFPDRCTAIADAFHSTESAPVRARPLVLLIDDDPETEHILSSRLRKSGVEVLYAADGKEGFAVARREKPSVIVTDYHMPYGDAIYLLSRLRNDPATWNLPVVVMTGRHLDEMIRGNLMREFSGRPGAASVMQKSFEIDDLLTAIAPFVALDRRAVPVPSRRGEMAA